MSQTLLSTEKPIRSGSAVANLERLAGGPAGLIAITALAVGGVLAFDLQRGAHFQFPHLAPFLKIPLVLKVHLVAAAGALLIGTALLFAPKGRGFHRAAGWTWAACMATVAISSFWLRDAGGKLSFIHLLSGWVSIAIPMAIAAARRHDLRRHRAAMTRVFMFGLVLAGALTLMPGRLMWHVFLR
jgi:uncharacterized membrane protein